MKRIVATITRQGYQRIAKPLLFKQSPDKVHKKLISAAKFISKVPIVRSLPRLWSYKNKEYLSQNIHGIDFENPIGLSAGFDKNLEMPGIINSVGFGFMTAGSVTDKLCAGNPKPWFFRLPKTGSLVVNAGLANEGSKTIFQRLNKYNESIFNNLPLNISVAKANSPEVVSTAEGIRDYIASIKRFNKSSRVKMFEINISCPNTYGGEPFTTPQRLNKLLGEVDKVNTKKPIFVKMPSDMSWDEFDKLLSVVVKHNIAGVTIGNLRKNRAAAKISDKLPESTKGNLSGAPTREITTELVRKTYQKYGDKLTIIGVGGVFSADDAYEKILAGSSLVALITGLIFEGPQIVGEINRGLVKLLKRDGYKNVHEAIGKGVNKV